MLYIVHTYYRRLCVRFSGSVTLFVSSRSYVYRASLLCTHSCITMMRGAAHEIRSSSPSRKTHTTRYTLYLIISNCDSLHSNICSRHIPYWKGACSLCNRKHNISGLLFTSFSTILNNYQSEHDAAMLTPRYCAGECGRSMACLTSLSILSGANRTDTCFTKSGIISSCVFQRQIRRRRQAHPHKVGSAHW